MNARDHEALVAQLSGYLDGDLSPREAEAVEAHLAACPSCRVVLNDLRSIVTQARALGDVAPARDLWPEIARAIGGHGERSAQVIRFPGAPLPDEQPRRGMWFSVPQLAAAAAALVLFSASATWWAGAGLGSREGDVTASAETGGFAARMASDAGAPSPELAQELAALETSLAEARDRLDPNTVRILEKNLGVIQRAIDESLNALAVDPANPFLKDHLERAYREKADFLREVTSLVAWEG